MSAMKSARPARGARPYHHGDLRRALIDAALELSMDKGVGSVSFREIARTVGVSQTAPYRHFPDLEHLLAAASEDGLIALRIELARAFDESEGAAPLERIEGLSRAYVRFSLRHRGHFRMMFGPGSPHPSTTPSLQAAARDTFQLFLSKVSAAWPTPSPRGIDARSATLHLWAVAHGVATLAIDGRAAFLGLDPSSAEQLSSRIIRTQLAGMVGERTLRTPASKRSRKGARDR